MCVCCSLPVWLPIKKGTGGVDVHSLVVHKCFVAFLRVLSSCIAEESGAHCFLNLSNVLATCDDIKLMSVAKKGWQIVPSKSDVGAHGLSWFWEETKKKRHKIER